MAARRVIEIILRWLEERPDIPDTVARKLAIVNNAQRFSARTASVAAQSVAEYMERQKLLAAETGGVIPKLEQFGEKAIDITAIQSELATSLRKPLYVIEAASRRALPQIGAELTKFGVLTKVTRDRAGRELQGIGIIATGLAEEIENVSAPKITAAFAHIRDRTGMTSADMIKSFALAARAQKRVADIIMGTSPKAAKAFVDSGELIKAAEKELGKTGQLTAEQRAQVARKVAEVTHEARRKEAEAAKRGLSVLKDTTAQIVSQEEFLAGAEKFATGRTREAFDERSRAAREMAEEVVSAQEKMDTKIVDSSGIVITEADKQAEAAGKVTPAIAALRKKYEGISKAGLEASTMLDKNQEYMNSVKAVAARFAMDEERAAQMVDYFSGKIGIQLEKVRFLGKSYDETTARFSRFADAFEAGTSAGIGAIYEEVKAEQEHLATVDALAESLVRTGGVLDDDAKKKLAAAQASWGWKELTEKLSRALLKQMKVVAAAGDSTDGWGRKIQGAEKWFDRWGKKIGRVGMRIGWFAYRLVMMGRIMMRYVQQPIQFGIKVMTEWEKSLETVATTLGLLEATGQATGESTEFLSDTMDMLVEDGLKFQAAWMEVQSILIGIAVRVMPIFIVTLRLASAALLTIWSVVGPKVVPALERLAVEVLPMLISALIRLAPAIVPLVEGLITGIQWVVALMDALAPVVPLIATVVGIFIAFAPILMAVGFALYLISPILIAVSYLFGGLAKILTLGRVASQMYTTALALQTGVQVTATTTTAKLTVFLYQHRVAILGVVGAIMILLSLFLVFSKRQDKVLKGTLKNVKTVLPKIRQLFKKETTGSLLITRRNLAELRQEFADMTADVVWATDEALMATTETLEEQTLIIRDSTGEIAYYIDTIAGVVYDSAWGIVGIWDAATGQIKLDTGDVISVFETLDLTVETTSGDVITSLEELQAGIGGLATSMTGPGGLTESIDDLSGSMGDLGEEFDDMIGGLDQSLTNTLLLTGGLSLLASVLGPILGQLIAAKLGLASVGTTAGTTSGILSALGGAAGFLASGLTGIGMPVIAAGVLLSRLIQPVNSATEGINNMHLAITAGHEDLTEFGKWLDSSSTKAWGMREALQQTHDVIQMTNAEIRDFYKDLGYGADYLDLITENAIKFRDEIKKHPALLEKLAKVAFEESVFPELVEWTQRAAENMTQFSNQTSSDFRGLESHVSQAARSVSSLKEALRDPLQLVIEKIGELDDRTLAPLTQQVHLVYDDTSPEDITAGLARARETIQHITVYATISIGTIAGVADLDMVQDVVDRGIAEGIRRALP